MDRRTSTPPFLLPLLLLLLFTRVFPVLVVKVAVVDDFNTELHPLKAETIELPRSTTSSSSNEGSQRNLFIPLVFLPIFFSSRRSKTQITSNTEAFEASKKIVSCGLCYPMALRLNMI